MLRRELNLPMMRQNPGARRLSLPERIIMSQTIEVSFASLADIKTEGGAETLVIFAGDELALSAATRKALGSAADLVKRAAATAKFKGKPSSAMDLLAPAGLGVGRLVVAGAAPAMKPSPGAPELDYVAMGGHAMGKANGAASVAILLDLPEWRGDPVVAAAEFAMGMQLRAYQFDLYKTKKKDEDDKPKAVKVTIGVADPKAVRRAMGHANALADGVKLARSLVNEPPNVLFPVEFAKRASELSKLGVEIEVLDVKAMTKLGMNALLGVGQGSMHESRLVIMRWNGGKKGAAPVAFIGKGVTFDSGGISLKPGGGMEDMKGDMAGAACVTGLRHIQGKFKPKFMINLATLTGAILVALGNEYAGLFSNSDELSERLTQVGLATGEKVWRMPLGPAYDKLIDSKFADMKNVGGRHAGSITAAQLLQRFVNDVPWAHLDIAGTGMASPQNDINQSWGSGWGVRLLDRLVAEHYEG